MRPKSGRIKDSVHGYVAFTRIEREFLDDPLTQRLRWISQSGLAHYVFPEVRTSRFAHSLGAMHLSSRFLAGALRNTSVEIREPLEDAIKEAVQESRVPQLVVTRMGRYRPWLLAFGDFVQLVRVCPHAGWLGAGCAAAARGCSGGL